MRFASFAVSTIAALAVVEGKEKVKQFPEKKTPSDGVNPLIYGGTEAMPGEYPYFVNLPGCGGALIARDTVLTAAHCGSYQGSTMYVGAYRDQSLDEGAVIRTCAGYMAHPDYTGNSGSINDWAICILNEPVDIPQDEVLLTLNTESEDDFPIVGEELEAMGFGSLGNNIFFPRFPDILMKTTLEGRTCSSGIPEQVCAGGADGQNGVTDVCRGDSGGPLVKVIPQDDGPDLHVHVGLVSSGALCPAALTGTYARTSAGASWINEAQCMLGSPSGTNCPTPPPPVVCDDSQSTLVINVETDRYASENRWELERMSGFQEFELIAENPLSSGFTQYSDTYCLEPMETYRWTLFDTFGDGLCFRGVCGLYTIELDGEEIARGDDFENEAIVVTTGGDCTDGMEQFRIDNPQGGFNNVVCDQAAGFLAGQPNRANVVCNVEAVDGGILQDYCPSTCGANGEGRCA